MAKRKGTKAKLERKRKVQQREIQKIKRERNRPRVFVGAFANLAQKWIA